MLSESEVRARYRVALEITGQDHASHLDTLALFSRGSVYAYGEVLGLTVDEIAHDLRCAEVAALERTQQK